MCCCRKQSRLTLTMFADHKNRLEAQNHGVLMAFGSQLDQSLKDMHKTILGSVSQQHEQLRCMEEHICSFLARKCDVRNEIY